MELLQHFCHPKHPLVFNQNDRRGHLCEGCQELVLVLAIVVKNAEGLGFIINHVWNYPLGCTIPCTQSILLFSLTNTHIILKRKKRANAKSVNNLVMNTLIDVTVATLIFTSDVALAYLPWKLNSTTTPIDTHLEVDHENREDINLLELKDGENEDAELDQSVESAAAYKVKNIKVGEDGTEIVTEIEHFSHEHDLKLIDEGVHNNEKCNGGFVMFAKSSYKHQVSSCIDYTYQDLTVGLVIILWNSHNVKINLGRAEFHNGSE
ncbi:hypothetical protein CFP56_025897 [Quercus suber]|uniref:Uncharacterized protein n=1 Tax=Quercus suber TaxID=58331 RepID=A0AAW0LYG9_QUESU